MITGEKKVRDEKNEIKQNRREKSPLQTMIRVYGFAMIDCHLISFSRNEKSPWNVVIVCTVNTTP